MRPASTLTRQPIGVFDSGFGGLTVLRDIVAELPQYDFIYLGDNARAPYGPRSFDTVYHYTLECVRHLFSMGCELVILACNTASAKALRTIQQHDLPVIAPTRRVLGVIRPTTEMVGKLTRTNKIGIMGTSGTVNSGSYVVEIGKFFPAVTVVQQACPMLVPLIENGEHNNEGADFFVNKYVHALMTSAPDIDLVVLACTHYPLIENKIREHLPSHVKLLSQGRLVASSLKNYLDRHPEMRSRCSTIGSVKFFTTDMPETFDEAARVFFGREVRSEHLAL